MINAFAAITYTLLWCINLFCLNIRNNKFVISATLLFVGILMCGHAYVGNGDSWDLGYYESDYELIDKENIENYRAYYLFFGVQLLCKTLSLSYFQWWFIMTFLSLTTIIIVIKQVKLNGHFILSFFMIFAMVLFTSLKMYYGLCVFLIGYFFLINGDKKGIFIYIIAVLIASGIQPMFYFFLILLVLKIKKINVKIIALVPLIFSLCILLLGRNLLLRFISIFIIQNEEILGMDKTHFLYNQTQMGFLIPIALHLSTLAYTHEYLRCIQFDRIECEMDHAQFLYNSVYLMFLLYPFFFSAITYSRYVFILFIVAIFVTSKGYNLLSKNKRAYLLSVGIAVLSVYIIEWIGPGKMIDFNFIPFFDNIYIKALFK